MSESPCENLAIFLPCTNIGSKRQRRQRGESAGFLSCSDSLICFQFCLCFYLTPECEQQSIYMCLYVVTAAVVVIASSWCRHSWFRWVLQWFCCCFVYLFMLFCQHTIWIKKMKHEYHSHFNITVFSLPLAPFPSY